ncbi:MAG: hypothetical protein ACRD3O_06125 [Terriglobia bacterium]
MVSKRLLSALLATAALLFLPPASPAQSKPGQTGKTQPQPGDEFVVPAHTQIPLALTSAVSSRTAYVGEPIYCQTVYPVDIDNRIVIPVGTYVKGTITEVVRPGHVHRRAMLGLRFDSMILPSGLSKVFSGTLAGFAGNGNETFNRNESKIKGAGDKGRDAKTVAVTTGEGAGIGGIAGVSSGHTGAGVAAGAVGGAIGGLIYVFASRGKQIFLRAGADLQLELARPLVFYRYQLGFPENLPSGPAFPKRDPGPGL